MNALSVEIPREGIAQIAREVFESMNVASIAVDGEAEQTRQTIERIMAKRFITVSELQILLNCSRGYIGKLIEDAADGKSAQPLPYCDLNGLIMFEPGAVIDWARMCKPLQRSKRKQGGKKPQRHLREIKQAVNA
jgi:hypothetical protein